MNWETGIPIIDPLNRKLIKNSYDEAGRLTGQADNEGNIEMNWHHHLQL
jgi:hypothetical protein